MNYLLDTCVISDFFKKNASVINRFEALLPEQICISSITVMEIEFGLKLNPEREKKIRPLWSHLNKFIQTIPYTPSCAIASGKFRAHLKELGLIIGPYDILLAGSAFSHNLVLVTSNMREFERLPEITIENWR